jgi:hypothetical protein
VFGFADRIIGPPSRQEDSMQNSTIKEYLFVAVLSLLVAALVGGAFVSFHVLQFPTVVH